MSCAIALECPGPCPGGVRPCPGDVCPYLGSILMCSEFSLAGALSVPNHDPRVVEVSTFVTDGHVCASKILDIFVPLGARCPVRLLWSAGRV